MENFGPPLIRHTVFKVTSNVDWVSLGRIFGHLSPGLYAVHSLIAARSSLVSMTAFTSSGIRPMSSAICLAFSPPYPAATAASMYLSRARCVTSTTFVVLASWSMRVLM